MKKHHSFEFPAMGGEGKLYFIEEYALAQEASGAAIHEIMRIEVKYSRYRVDNMMAKINTAAKNGSSVELDEETGGLIDFAFACYKQSDGLFDISSGPLRQVWDFSTNHVPGSEQIGKLLPRIGMDKVSWNGSHLSFQTSGMELDFGGIGKEYAVDRAADICHALGVRSALVDLGGDIRVVGPSPDGHPWSIFIRHPRRPDEAAKTIALVRGAVATSGDYERYFEVNGRRYCHVINPKSGNPVQTLCSATVTADRCMAAGAAATIAMLKEQDAERWLSDNHFSSYWMAIDGACGGNL